MAGYLQRWRKLWRQSQLVIKIIQEITCMQIENLVIKKKQWKSQYVTTIITNIFRKYNRINANSDSDFQNGGTATDHIDEKSTKLISWFEKISQLIIASLSLSWLIGGFFIRPVDDGQREVEAGVVERHPRRRRQRRHEGRR